MAIPRRTQVALGTLAVFVVSLAGLAVFSFSNIVGQRPTTLAEPEAGTLTLSFSPTSYAGKVGEKNVVVDLVAEGRHDVLGATIGFQFDPKLMTITEVDSEQGILGRAQTAFDFDQGLLTLSFKPGQAVSPHGRVVTFLLELTAAGRAGLDVVAPASELIMLRNGVIEKQRPTLNGGVVFEISSP